MNKYWGVFVLFLAILASAGLAQAAVIHGSVYDLELNVLSQAVVEINTAPRQVLVSRNGTYVFTVPQGNYVISARQEKLDLVARENVTVRQDGDYVLDLILFPDLGVEEELLNESLDVPEYDEPTFAFPTRAVIVLLVFAASAALAWWYRSRRKPTNEEAKKQAPKTGLMGQKQEKAAPTESAGLASSKLGKAAPTESAGLASSKLGKADLEEILAFVRREGGRTTQKDLRRAIPYSEAKISLMVAELESQGRLKKIKKGRGNIIFLP